MDKKGLILSILAILAVFGLAIGGFFIYKSYQYRKAEKQFEKGNIASLETLLTRPKRFEAFARRLLEKVDDSKIIEMVRFLRKARNIDKRVPSVKYLSKSSIARYWFSMFEEDNFYHDLETALAYYPSGGLYRKVRHILLNDKDNTKRIKVAHVFRKCVDKKDAVSMFIQVIEKEKDAEVIEFIARMLVESGVHCIDNGGCLLLFRTSGSAMTQVIRLFWGIQAHTPLLAW
jgi:hypothetical protein